MVWVKRKNIDFSSQPTLAQKRQKKGSHRSPGSKPLGVFHRLSTGRMKKGVEP
jgi:hypothetical protein